MGAPMSSSTAGRSSASRPGAWPAPWVSATSRCRFPGVAAVGIGSRIGRGMDEPALDIERKAAHLLRRATFGYTAAQLDAPPRWHTRTSSTWSSTRRRERCRQVDNRPITRRWFAPGTSTWRRRRRSSRSGWLSSGTGCSPATTGRPRGCPSCCSRTSSTARWGASDFRTLINAVTYDPLMIRYLDLEESTAAAPNENYSRELMELFTLGVGNYTETDVREGARAFSGIRTVLVDVNGRRVPAPKLKGSTPTGSTRRRWTNSSPRARPSKESSRPNQHDRAARRSSAIPATWIRLRLSTSSCRSPHARRTSPAARSCSSARRIRRPRSINSVATRVPHQQFRHQDADAIHLHQ